MNYSQLHAYSQRMFEASTPGKYHELWRGGGGGASVCLPVSRDGGWWRRRVTWQLHCCPSMHHRLIAELRLQLTDGICFLFPLTVRGEIFIQQRWDPPKKKKKKKKYGFLCDRTAATASAFRQTVTQKSAKREDYRVSVLLCQSRLPLKYHVGGSVWTSSLSSCMFSTRVFNYFYMFLGYICI